MMLRDFLSTNRDEILARARGRVAQRSADGADDVVLSRGLTAFLDQLRHVLLQVSEGAALDHDAIKRSARRHGDALYEQGRTVAQVATAGLRGPRRRR